MTGEIALPTPDPTPLPRTGVASVRESMDTLKAIRTFIKEEFRKDLDFGVIPNTKGKPTLFQPGAQKIVMYFNAAPDHEVRATDLGDGHVEYLVTTRLIHRATGAMIGSGVGSCSTMEKKYRYRGGNRKCPRCGKEAIFKSREARGGWYCWAKKDGCGAKFADQDPAIVAQPSGEVENPDIYDVRNTVLKMATKRSLVCAALSLGCAAELFTQDQIEDTYDLDDGPAKAPSLPSNASGHKTGIYASPEQIAAYLKATGEFCGDRNADWLDSWQRPDGSVTAGVQDLLHPIQLTRHLLKFCVREGHLADVPLTIDPATGKLVEKTSSEQDKALVAVVFARDPGLIGDEAWDYYHAEAARARLAIEAKLKEEAILATEGGRA